MAKKGKDLTLKFMPEEVVGAEVMRSGDYKYASIAIKKNDNERCRISYEWSGDAIPDFVMGIMAWMQANQEVVDQSKNEEEFAAIKERL